MALSAARPSPGADAAPYRVMLVDDSAVVRGFFRRALAAEPDIEIVASVGNGEAAIAALARAPAEVVVLDIDMPVMDGLAALPRLLALDPALQVIMASTLSATHADTSLKALALGAVEYIPKPSAAGDGQAVEAFRHELAGKIKALGRARRRLPAARPLHRRDVADEPARRGAIRLRPASALAPAVLAIGCSTGGPQALLRVIEGLGNHFALPVLVAQHMPATFTGILAAHIEKATGREAREGADGEPVRPGCVYVAPGDFHMLAESAAGGPVIRLSQSPPENFCRPSVDPLLRSLAAVYGGRLLAAILTGMGHDGLGGAHSVVERGGTVVAQDEATSVVWGMPGAVAGAGLCSAVLPLDALAGKIRRLCGQEAA